MTQGCEEGPRGSSLDLCRCHGHLGWGAGLIPLLKECPRASSSNRGQENTGLHGVVKLLRFLPNSLLTRLRSQQRMTQAHRPLQPFGK